MSHLGEYNPKRRSDRDELQMQHDDHESIDASWKQEKERMFTKILDLTKAYDSSAAAQADQQSQMVALDTHDRDMRGVLNDAEVDRARLQKARRALQSELVSIKLASVKPSNMTSKLEVQRLSVMKQDMQRS